MKPILIEDLLGRPQNRTDKEAIKAMLYQRRILVTGAGGTIGAELCRQIASYAPASLCLVENSEYNLYKIDLELQNSFPAVPRTARIADIRNQGLLERIFTLEKPELVFHAAALKHVPLTEANPLEAVMTNCIGTKHVADACITHGVHNMVLVSTDKAVNPTNIMGCTKRIAEKYIHSLAMSETQSHPTVFSTVRFGNVLGSSGSVIPLFTQQIERGGPITITHPDMVRYFMTVGEAVELVLQACVLGDQRAKQCAELGNIFVLDMGEPVRIEELALQMIKMAGLRPHIDIAISYTGLRPGEKLYEELFYTDETLASTPCSAIRLALPTAANLEEIQYYLPQLLAACQQGHKEMVLTLVQQLVPDYTTPESLAPSLAVSAEQKEQA